MYFRKMRPSTTYLYSAASIEPWSASAIAQSSDSSMPMGEAGDWLAWVEPWDCLAGMATVVRLWPRE